MKQQAAHHDFLANGGKMGKLIVQTDWTDHPFGPIETWPQSLQSTLSVCLTSKFPMAIYWGKDLRLLYNDAYSPIPGEKHPLSLGQPAKQVWSNIWNTLRPDINQVMRNGASFLYEAQTIAVNQRGFVEESYFDYAYSPIYGENHEILGVFNIAQQVTSRILAERRNRTISSLSSKSIIPESPEAACILIANVLSEAPSDVTFALIYLLNKDTNTLRLAASTSLEKDTSIASGTIDLSLNSNDLPFSEVLKTKKTHIFKDSAHNHELPGGVWEEPASCAVFMPIVRPHTKELYGVLVGGISPRLKYDREYTNYYAQIAELTAFSIGNAYDLRRKLALEAREQQAQERLKAALSTGSIGVWVWNIPENKVFADSNLAYRFGVEPEDAANGLPLSVFTDSIHPDDQPWVKKEIQLAVKKTKFLDVEYRTITHDGSTRWVLARGKVEDDVLGNPVRFPGVMVDITERKKIEQQLASSERMFNALFESSIIGVAVMTLDGQIHETNETFLNMFGYKKIDLKQGFYTHMITPSKSKGVTSTFYQTLRDKGEVKPTEREYVRKNGTTIPVLVGGVIIPGSTDRFITFMLDISEQKQLKALNQAKDEFISIASHQLRTPATGVKQYLGMLIEGYAGELTSSQEKMLRTAYSSNERQLDIVNDLLRVAQADANGITLRQVETNVEVLLRDVIDEQAKKFEALNQNVEFKNICKDSTIPLDRLHIRMVFENLIDNAHKYTPENKDISVKMQCKKSSMVITIKDHGVGIYKKDMPKLFKKFSRIDNPLSTSAGGTGLGLYLVHKIIDLHGGTITVTSKYRQGSEFIISLPLKAPSS